MKLLTWMHRKFKQGQPLLDHPNFYHKQNHCNETWRQVHRDGQPQLSFTNHETPNFTDFEERESMEFSDLFQGFLTIGTLGTEAGFTEPETPNFDVSFNRLAEEEHEVTENELRIINDELEKVLAAEAKDDGWTDSSSRNSHVSNGRISHASTITLSGKPLEIPESTNLNCPLQEYLLGSAVEMPEKAAVPKKENRTSLGELFEKQKAEEISVSKPKKGEKREDKETEKTGMNLMKKIPKKKIPSAASKNSAAAETKLFKILHKFHRKVHPECLITATEKPDKSHKMRFKDMIPCNAGYYKNKHTFSDEDISNLSQKARRMAHMRVNNNSHTSSSEFNVDATNSNGSRECWIKTDADYLVLEL
ncbi:protein LAZY 1-like isoform X2 [Silene latifolia]|uniref:protein LAZY 1-like isoform X2 n=1 Tax=Silene latifolia TaxID=37657 RepID=UPI003D784BC9